MRLFFTSTQQLALSHLKAQVEVSNFVSWESVSSQSSPPTGKIRTHMPFLQ